MIEVCNAIKTKEGTEEKKGTPPRNPKVRSVIKVLADMGEFTAPGAQEDDDA